MSKYTTYTSIFTGILSQHTVTTFGTASAIECLDEGERCIDGFIARRYDVSSFTSTAEVPLLKNINNHLTGYYLLRANFTNDGQNINEWVNEFYQRAIEKLEQLRDRKIDLVDSDGDLISERGLTSKYVSSTKDYHPTFDEGPVLDQLVDPDKTEDIADEKA